MQSISLINDSTASFRRVKVFIWTKLYIYIYLLYAAIERLTPALIFRITRPRRKWRLNERF